MIFFTVDIASFMIANDSTLSISDRSTIDIAPFAGTYTFFILRLHAINF